MECDPFGMPSMSRWTGVAIIVHRCQTDEEELHRYWAEKLAQADALLFGRVTYEMMEAAWRWPATGVRPGWMTDWMEPFARTIDAAEKLCGVEHAGAG